MKKWKNALLVATVSSVFVLPATAQLVVKNGADIDMTGSAGSQIVFPDGTTLGTAPAGGGGGTIPDGHGGTTNTVSGTNAYIGGRLSNTASNTYTTASGGNSNRASGFAATVGGGQANTATGDYSTVSGGWSTDAASQRMPKDSTVQPVGIMP